MASVFKSIRWAMSVPTLFRSDGRPDTVAHLVLIVLASFADKNGTNARPSLALLAKRSHLTTLKAAADALERLEAAGLVSQSGELVGGVVVWQLNFDAESAAEDDEFERRLAARRRAATERQRRHRKRVAGTNGHAVAGRDGHGLPERDGHAVADRDVTLWQGVSHAVAERESRSGQRYNRRSPRLHQPIDQPKTSHIRPKERSDDDEKRAPDGIENTSASPRADDHGGRFAEFWDAYPKRVAKQAAEKAWAKALQSGVDAIRLVEGARRYAAQRDGQDPRYTKHPATWLSSGCWDDEPEPARPVARVNGHAAWTNPADQSVYDEGLY
jgi:hypothetical protein